MAKTSVQVYYDYTDQFELLDDAQFRKIIYAMIEYDKTGKHKKLDKITNIAFSFIKKRIDYDQNKYFQKCEKNKKNIERYWKSKAKNERIRTNTNVNERIPTDTKNTDIDIDIELDIDTDIDIDLDITNNSNNNKKRERESKKVCDAHTPVFSDILDYGKEKDVDEKYCERFFNHYESIGWVNGNGLDIKNWKLVFINWINKDKQNNNITKKQKKRVL